MSAAPATARQRSLTDALEVTHEGPLIVHSADPLCAGPDVARLVEAFVTPTPVHFVRTHGPIPNVDVDAYRLRIDGLVGHPVELDIAELHGGFAQYAVTATLQCAGNRRQELHALRPFRNEVLWGGDAVGTATWRGPRLVDLLSAAGVDPRASHVWFEGLDQAAVDGRPIPFGGSVAVGRAVRTDVLVATQMNGRPLTAAHGAPARLVVPGFIGARSIKWLGRVTLADRPSENHFQAHGYRIVEADSGVAGPAIEAAPLNAFIGSIGDGDEVPAGQLRLTGYATPSGTERVTAVEVALDGDTWRPAGLLDPPAAGRDVGALGGARGPWRPARTRCGSGHTTPGARHSPWTCGRRGTREAISTTRCRPCR